jgi:hypothetical protein
VYPSGRKEDMFKVSARFENRKPAHLHSDEKRAGSMRVLFTFRVSIGFDQPNRCYQATFDGVNGHDVLHLGATETDVFFTYDGIANYSLVFDYDFADTLFQHRSKNFIQVGTSVADRLVRILIYFKVFVMSGEIGVNVVIVVAIYSFGNDRHDRFFARRRVRVDTCIVGVNVSG